MTSKLLFITVWECEVQTCLWVPYKPKLCQCIENAFRSSKGRINLGIESQEMACFEINFSVLKQENIYTNESMRVRQQQYPFNSPLAKGIIWSWRSDWCWELYDVPTMMYIEDEFQKKRHGVDLSCSPLRIPNVINFTNMVQVNKITNKSRGIHRHKENEQYPVAVFQTQSTTRTSTPQMLAPQLSASGHQQHHNNPLPMHNVGVTKHGNSTSSNLLFSVSGVQNGHLPVVNGVKSIMVPGASVLHFPSTSGSLGGPLASFTIPVQVTGRTDDECAICLQNLMAPSDYDIPDPGVPAAEVQCVSPDILKLINCKHMFHRICLQKMYNAGTKNGCLQCPTCKTIHGIKLGNQPSGGTMDVKTNTVDIPGYPGYGSIVIVYNFKGGTQGQTHPNPGQRYTPNGFPRTCYLPNNSKGKTVLQLLQKAFERRLVFTIGTSVTTGATDAITWNDIHHKTEGYQNTTGYGYPDPNYLDNTLAELALHGVTD